MSVRAKFEGRDPKTVGGGSKFGNDQISSLEISFIGNLPFRKKNGKYSYQPISNHRQRCWSLGYFLFSHIYYDCIYLFTNQKTIEA